MQQLPKTVNHEILPNAGPRAGAYTSFEVAQAGWRHDRRSTASVTSGKIRANDFTCSGIDVDENVNIAEFQFSSVHRIYRRERYYPAEPGFFRRLFPYPDGSTIAPHLTLIIALLFRHKQVEIQF